MKKIITVLATLSFVGCFGPSDEQLQRAQTECENFVLEKVANKYRDETHIFDTFTKDGKIVVEVGYREKNRSWGDDSYSVRICLYDEEQGRIQIPSVFNMGQWKR